MTTGDRTDFSPHYAKPFLDGVYLAINAIPDAALIVDAPSCVMGKVERIQGNHDWFSDLVTTGRKRILHSNLNLPELSAGDQKSLFEVIRNASPDSGISAIFLTALSLVTVTGRDLGLVVDEISEELEKSIIEIPSRDLYSDWLDGYSETLLSLAREIPPPEAPGEASADSVAVIGYLMDRNEADHHANLAEIRRLIESLGLEVSTIWPSGAPLAELAKAANASALISLPYGRKAAKELSKRFDVPHIAAPVPIGFDRTADFLRVIGEALGREKLAEKAVREGEREVLPKLKWVVPRWFVDRGFAIMAEPFALESMVDFLSGLGARAELLFSPTLDIHVPKIRPGDLPKPLVFDPSNETIGSEIRRCALNGELDLCIGDTFFCQIANHVGIPALEYGYPSHFTHRLIGHPTYGYQGVLGIAERWANSIGRGEAGRAT